MFWSATLLVILACTARIAAPDGGGAHAPVIGVSPADVAARSSDGTDRRMTTGPVDPLPVGVAPVAAPGDGAFQGQWPLRPPPPVMRRFDPPAHPWDAGHRGVDLAAAPGRSVFATGAGRVAFARDLAGRGVVSIVHGSLRTTYLPVRPTVRTGQTVVAGARIGVVEGVLGHCGQTSCLHWGLRRGDSYLDPLSLLGLGPVRLLPWWRSWANTTGTDGGGRRPSSPSGPGEADRSAPARRPIGRSPAARPGGSPPATAAAGTAPSARPVGATTGIGTAVDPIAIAGAAMLTLFALRTRRRGGDHARPRTRRPSHRHRHRHSRNGPAP